MSLRWRLTTALLLVVIAAVTGGTAAHLAEVSRRLEATIGFALVSRGCVPGDRVAVLKQGRPVPGTLTELPFL